MNWLTAMPRSGRSVPSRIDPHGPARHIVVADHENVRDLFQLGVPHPRTERLVGGQGLGPETRRPQCFYDRTGVGLVVVAHREHLCLYRRQPSGECAGVMLGEDGKKAFYGTEQRPVDHVGTVAGVVGAHVLHLEALREHVVNLDRDTCHLRPIASRTWTSIFGA